MTRTQKVACLQKLLQLLLVDTVNEGGVVGLARHRHLRTRVAVVLVPAL